MEFQFATVWESIADVLGDRPALSHAGRVRTWTEFDERAARLAAAFAGAGLGTDTKVAMYLYNGPEYLEAEFAARKVGAVPVNVNYRYLDTELAYLLDNADAEAIVFHSSLGERVARVASSVPGVRLLVQVDDDGGPLVDGAVRFEDVIAGHAPLARRTRSEDEIMMLYTGGTTGMPKGVMYRMGNTVTGYLAGAFSQIGLEPPADAAAIAPTLQRFYGDGGSFVSVPCAPLMHGTGLCLGALIPQMAGAEIVTLAGRSFDPHELLAAVEARGVTSLAVVGDPFSKPVVRALDEGAGGRAYDTTTLRRIYSSGAMWTAEVKQQLLDRVPQVALYDLMNSTEGAMGLQVTTRGAVPTTAAFALTPTSKVFTEDGREVQPGSDEVGFVASGGNVPLGYYKDPEKTARTFREIDGVRYSFPGDLARLAADGTVILLGRGSQVINTAGEKVFPEEVEEAVKRVPGVLDCLVVGVDDDRWGQAVTAVVSSTVDGLDDATVITAVKRELAGYKAPRRVVFVDVVPRAPNGKADYAAARELARNS